MVVINCPGFVEDEERLEVFKGVKGSIVRLYMEDFVTYRKVEMRAGPHVNLILGLNGTGKSTIVCAICLGLAGKPTILGRANNLKAYIRHGASASKIEIELFNPNGLNFLITRLIRETETGCISNWILNKKKVKLERIEQLTKDLNIQLDNLCQFLPQDRVQEFAEMDSIRLLESTEEAIGNDTLSANHKRLVEINSSIAQSEKSLTQVTNSYLTEQQQNLSLETDVQTYQKREKIKKTMEELEQNIAWIKYIDAGAVFNLAQSDLRELTNKKKQEENKLSPLKKGIENLEAQLVKFSEQMQKIKQKNFAKWYSIQHTYNANKETVASTVSEINLHLSQAEKKEEEKRRRYDLCLQKVQGYETELIEFKARGEHDEELLRAQLVELETERTDIMREIINITFLDDKDKAEKLSLNHKITTSESELARLDDLRVSRMKFLERNFQDVFKAVKFFEHPQNRSQLKGRIHEPMLLHICVTDLAYGKIAECHLGMSDMTAFFCENKDDVETLTKLSNELKIRISVIHYNPVSNFTKTKTTLRPDFMKKYHFQKVLIDLLEAPDYYMSYICSTFFPENVPIGTSDTDAMSKEIIDATNLRTFYTDSYAYRIQISYYSRQKCSTTSYIQSLTPRIFTSEINANERTKLQGNIRTMKEDYQKLSDNISGRSERLKKQERDKEINLKKIKDTNTKIEVKSRLEQKVKTSKEAVEKLGKELVDLTETRQKASQDCYDRRMQKLTALESIGSATTELSSNGLIHNVMKLQLSVLQCRFITKQNQYEDAKKRVDEDNSLIEGLNIRVKAAADIAEKLKKEAIKKSQSDKPPQSVVDGLLDIAELEKNYNSEKGRLINLVEKDHSVIKQYEEKLKCIEELKNKKENLENCVVTLKSEMDVLKSTWLGPLKDLIGRINRNFSRFFENMQCGGKVYLDKGEDENDFGRYGIKIHVSFRAGEQMSELCGWKQSGGERAITTALYVLALQELTTVPFRVIDEINQGMDAKNESRFFNLLCSLADGDSTPQYFLLTPKMLPPVEYPENVSFHFILNGPYVKDMFDGIGEETGQQPVPDDPNAEQYDDYSENLDEYEIVQQQSGQVTNMEVDEGGDEGEESDEDVEEEEDDD